ncbi:hypothetical protein [Crossiella cryophila]|uniref:Uncharacterized protein n=1 Tax=Crossiella cryophila TaxID=43355 RepID=A0A7W7C5T4_9PSEU|nr:hypothetical protein [Crossiella cryophila]MBB4675044.1 hypothetical protein [Crossiella cryophila]
MQEPTSPTIGALAVWSSSDLPGLGDQLLPRLTEFHLSTRLPDWRISFHAPFGWTRPLRTDGGLVAEPLGEYRPRRVSALAAADLTVITPAFPLGADLTGFYGGPVPGAEFFTHALGEHPVLVSAVRVAEKPSAQLVSAFAGQPYPSVRDIRSRDRLADAGLQWDVAVVPHPALLADSLVSPGALATRQGDLRKLRILPAEGSYLVLQLTPDLAGELATLPAVLEKIQDFLAIEHIVLLPTGPDAPALDGHLLPADLVLEDRIAVLAGASLVVAADEHAAAAAAGLDRRWVLLDPTGEQRWPVLEFGATKQIADRANKLLDAVHAALKPVASRRQAVIEHFDAIAEAAQRAASGRAPTRDLTAENRALRAANAALRERMFIERQRLVEQLAAGWQDSEPDADLESLRAELAEERRLHGELAERHRALAAEIDRLAADSTELAALRNTKLMRWAQPARDAYGKLRKP